jgi:hypothetical protein
VLPLPLPVSFQHVGQFPGGVLWLGPAPTEELLALHRETVARLDAADIPIWPLYRPWVWVPHSTLSMTARRAAVAKAVPLCSDIPPMPTELVAAAVADHTRQLWRPLPTYAAHAGRRPTDRPGRRSFPGSSTPQLDARPVRRACRRAASMMSGRSR